MTDRDIFQTTVTALEKDFGLREALDHRNALFRGLRKIVRTHCKDAEARRLARALADELFCTGLHLEQLRTLAAVAALGKFDRYVALHANPRFGEHIAGEYHRYVEWKLPMLRTNRLKTIQEHANALNPDVGGGGAR